MQLLDLDSSVPRQSFDWLVELAVRLNVVIEVIDVYDTPGVSRGSDPRCRGRSHADHQQRAVAAHCDGGRRSIANAGLCRHRGPAVRLLSPGRRGRRPARPPAGVSGIAADECREDLESIGPWMTGAIDASLAQPHTVSAEGFRIVSFRRILREASSRGSLRQVIGAFIEALSVWDDVRVRAYVAGASGGFFEYASSMTAHPASSGTDRRDPPAAARAHRPADAGRRRSRRADPRPGRYRGGAHGDWLRHGLGARLLGDDQRRRASSPQGVCRHPARVVERRADDEHQPDHGRAVTAACAGERTDRHRGANRARTALHRRWRTSRGPSRHDDGRTAGVGRGK